MSETGLVYVWSQYHGSETHPLGSICPLEYSVTRIFTLSCKFPSVGIALTQVGGGLPDKTVNTIRLPKFDRMAYFMDGKVSVCYIYAYLYIQKKIHYTTPPIPIPS